MPTTNELQAKIDVLNAQQALTVKALRAFVEGRMDGPDSVKWLLAAISPNDPPVVPADFEFGAQQ